MASQSELDRQTELLILYLRNMQKVKWRLQAIEEIKSKKRTTSFEHTNIEFCVLQIRKILELIALSSLVSDADIYKEQLNNVEKMWNARLILNDIERINPKFFPQPICIDPLNTSIWNKRQEPSLTRDSFVRIYERCGKYLHEDSPFKTEKQIKDEYNALWNDIGTWGQLIINLLYTHVVQLYNNDRLFYIALGEHSERPHGNIFEKIDESKLSN